jgi:hypothetical protein
MRCVLPSFAVAAALAVAASSAFAAPAKSALDDGAVCDVAGARACKAGSYCKRPFGACVADPAGRGVCSPIPDICSDSVKPVCGCNGKTYPNACMAEIDDASVAHEGSCNSSDLKSPKPQ